MTRSRVGADDSGRAAWGIDRALTVEFPGLGVPACYHWLLSSDKTPSFCEVTLPHLNLGIITIASLSVCLWGKVSSTYGTAHKDGLKSVRC